MVVERVRRDAELTGLDFAGVDGKRRDASDQARADVRPAAPRRDPEIGFDVVIEPGRAIGRNRRARGHDRPQRLQRVAGLGYDAGPAHDVDIARARAEEGDAALIRDPPQRLDVRIGRAPS